MKPIQPGTVIKYILPVRSMMSLFDYHTEMWERDMNIGERFVFVDYSLFNFNKKEYLSIVLLDHEGRNLTAYFGNHWDDVAKAFEVIS